MDNPKEIFIEAGLRFNDKRELSPSALRTLTRLWPLAMNYSQCNKDAHS